MLNGVMSKNLQFGNCQAYLRSVLETEVQAPKLQGRLPAITLSRMAGARGITLGEKLTEHLRAIDAHPTHTWTLFDKNLIGEVLKDHDLPVSLEKHMPEDKIGEIQSVIEEIVGLHPSHWDLFEKTAKTIRRLTLQGHVIVVGRGACLICNGMPNVLNVRLIGSHQRRSAHIRNRFKLSPDEAVKYIDREEGSRRAYFEGHFGKDIDNPVLYHLVINSDDLSDANIVQIIAGAAIRLTE